MIIYVLFDRVFGVMIFSAMSLGNANSFAPDYGKAKKAAAKMFQLFDREPLIDSSDPDGAKPVSLLSKLTYSGTPFERPPWREATNSGKST